MKIRTVECTIQVETSGPASKVHSELERALRERFTRVEVGPVTNLK